MAAGAVLTARGHPAGPVLFETGLLGVHSGLEMINAANRLDLQFFAGKVLETLDPVTREFLRMLLR